MESESEVADIQVWFNKDEQMNKILSKDKDRNADRRR